MRKDDIMELGAYFKSIIDQDRAAVVICSLDHKIIYMNPAAAANYHKYGGAELLGKSLLDCHGAFYLNALFCQIVQNFFIFFAKLFGQFMYPDSLHHIYLRHFPLANISGRHLQVLYL